MTPEEAAMCLRDDPTFALSSPLEQENEAALLLGTDDPLEIAMAVELALNTAAPQSSSTVTSEDEGCRLAVPCSSPPLAGNGRCLDCGASRKPVEPEKPVEVVKVIPPSEPIPKGPKAPVKRGPLRRGIALDPTKTFLGRFKEATGCTDKELSELLGIGRPTVHAYISGRRNELLDETRTKLMIDGLADRLLLLSELKRDLAVARGEVFPD